MSVEPPVFVLWFDFTKWLLAKTEKFPRRVRPTLSNRIENLALDITQEIVGARYSRSKARQLGEINLKLDQLRILLRLCHDMEYLDHKGYRYVSTRIDEAGKMLGGWRKQQEAKSR